MDSLFFVSLAKASKHTSTLLPRMEPPQGSTLSCTAQEQEDVVFTPELPLPITSLNFRRRRRSASFQVQYTDEDITQLAKEVYDGTIADVTLSLFSFWINEHQKHYDMAMEFIRELGLDKGYQTSRIPNQKLRKLLDETIGFRPSAPYFASNPTARGTPQSHKTSLAAMSVNSHPTKSDSSPRSGGEAAPCSNRSPACEPPPNTPDRPAPLNIRSRGSSQATPTPKPAASRSVSSPIPMRQGRLGLGSVTLPTTVMEATADLAALSMGDTEAGESSSVYSSDDEAVPNPSRSHTDICTNERRLFSDELEEIDAVLGHQAESTESSGGLSWDTETDVASLAETSITAATSSMFDRQVRHPISVATSNMFGSPSQYAAFPDLETRAAQPPSELVSRNAGYPVSRRSDRYAFTTGPVPTSAQRHAIAQTRRLARNQTNSDGTSGGNSGYYRPLPFRQLTTPLSSLAVNPIEDMDDTSNPVYTRSHSNPSLLSLSSALQLATAPSPAPYRRYDIPASNSMSSSVLDNGGILRRYDSDISLPHGHRLLRSATAPRPARSGNDLSIGGVSELEMRAGPRVLRRQSKASPRPKTAVFPSGTRTHARADSPTLATTSSLDMAPPTASSAAPTAEMDSLGEAYKSMTAAYFSSLLEKTRARATQLPPAEMSGMDELERHWRDVNKELIGVIYGRTDVVISETEKHFIDRVARELREGIGRKEGWECIVAKFKT